VRDIAAKAGVGTATIYRHFPTRADLIIAVYRHQVEACAAAGPDLLVTSASPHAALARWIDLFVDFLITKHGLAAVLQPDSAGFETLHTYFLDRLVPVCARLLDAAAAAGELRGRLTVGIIPTVTGIDLPAVLHDFLRAHPKVRIALRSAGSDDLAAGIRAGEVDVAVLGLPESVKPRGVRHRVLNHDRHVAVVAPDHPLAALPRVDLPALAAEPFADFPAGTPGRAQSDLAFAAAALTREVAFEAMSTDLMIGLIRRSLAVALLPSRFVADLPGLVTIPVTNGPARVEYLAWSDFNPTPAATAFLEIAAAQSTR